jgi:hypothetical protein
MEAGTPEYTHTVTNNRPVLLDGSVGKYQDQWPGFLAWAILRDNGLIFVVSTPIVVAVVLIPEPSSRSKANLPGSQRRKVG